MGFALNYLYYYPRPTVQRLARRSGLSYEYLRDASHLDGAYGANLARKLTAAGYSVKRTDAAKED